MSTRWESLQIKRSQIMTENYSLADMKSLKRNITTQLKSSMHWKIKQVRTESHSSKKFKCLTLKSVKKKNNSCNPTRKSKVLKICWLKKKVKLKISRKSWINKSKTVSKKYNKPISNTKNLMRSISSSKLTVKNNWHFASKEINS